MFTSLAGLVNIVVGAEQVLGSLHADDKDLMFGISSKNHR